MDDANLEELKEQHRGLDPVLYFPLSAIDKLKKQNEKLRSELKILSRALNEALDKQKKQERLRNRVPAAHDEAASETEKELEATLAKIARYKKEIGSMKKQLDGNLNDERVTALENQSKYLSGRIRELEAENESLQKIESEQKKALEEVQNAQNYKQRMQSLQQESRTLKDRYRELIQKQKQDEKILKDQHERCVLLEEKTRKLHALVKNKKGESDEPKLPEVTEQDIQELRTKMEETERKKKEEEGRLKARIRELEAQVREARHNVDVYNVRLKEKDQECRLNALKIKELKRAVRHNQLRPLEKPQSKAEEGSRQSSQEAPKSPALVEPREEAKADYAEEFEGEET